MMTGLAAEATMGRAMRHLSAVDATKVMSEADLARGRATFMDVVRFVLVSFYLTMVFGLLVVTRKVSLGFSVRHAVRRTIFKVRRHVALTELASDGGHCVTAKVDGRIPSDSNSYSRVIVFEDGKPLGMPHADHQSIRDKGLGRFSHWNGVVYFAASDNTDPATNGRKYTFKEI